MAAIERVKNSMIQEDDKCPFCQSKKLGEDWFFTYVSRYWYYSGPKRTAIEIMYFSNTKGESRDFRKKQVYDIKDTNLPGWILAIVWHRDDLDEL